MLSLSFISCCFCIFSLTAYIDLSYSFQGFEIWEAVVCWNFELWDHCMSVVFICCDEMGGFFFSEKAIFGGVSKGIWESKYW